MGNLLLGRNAPLLNGSKYALICPVTGTWLDISRPVAGNAFVILGGNSQRYSKSGLNRIHAEQDCIIIVVQAIINLLHLSWKAPP